MRLHNIEEIFDNLIWRIWSIHKEQVMVSNCPILEILLVIFFLVEPYDLVNPNIIEYINVFIWVVAVSMVLVPLLNWTHEGYEFSWNNPVEVSIFNSLVVFVFFYVEAAEIVPSKLHGVL